MFALPPLTPPASPLRRKTVLEYRFDHSVRVLSAALIPVSAQSVGPNPLMNVFSPLGVEEEGRGGDFKWRRIPVPALGGEQLERTPLLCLVPHLSHVASGRAQFIFRPVGGAPTAEPRLTSQVLAHACVSLALARERSPQSNLGFFFLDGLRARPRFTTRCQSFAPHPHRS